ncbi:hypothetical protein [Gloeocapsopsis sp. IPPAS B-1203]|uniref:hypothetical protein n=1 Tax=Gloeocapsopsis sp. IPPAS B-1203 TaxID=2049454 RepID=UPI00117F4332|nr:hypothetical protein [Gloeocapsopsis sp. IPPAS B-1203]
MFLVQRVKMGDPQSLKPKYINGFQTILQVFTRILAQYLIGIIGYTLPNLRNIEHHLHDAASI